MQKILLLISVILFLGSMLIYFYGDVDSNIETAPEGSYIIGRIYSVSENRILVAEEVEGEYDGSVENLRGKAVWLTLERETEFIDEDGGRVSIENLKLKEKVEVWVKGQILETYPAQASADKIFVVGDARKEEEKKDERKSERDHEKEEPPPEVDIFIEKKNKEIIFRAESSGDIYVPQRALSSPPYLTGPWELYYKGEDDVWRRRIATEKCAYPKCTAIDDMYEGCLPIPHPPPCETISEDIFGWDRKYVIRRKVMGTYCYHSVFAEEGEYKIVFNYKEEPCSQMNISFSSEGSSLTANEVFHDNIKSVEKEFFIEE